MHLSVRSLTSCDSECMALESDMAEVVVVVSLAASGGGVALGGVSASGAMGGGGLGGGGQKLSLLQSITHFSNIPTRC